MKGGARKGNRAPIAVLAVDMDDTLLNSQRDISPRTRRAIAEAQSRGVRVVLATGRMYSSARPYAEQLRLRGPLITYNGALVKTVEGKVLSHRPIPLEAAQEVLDLGAQARWLTYVYVDDRMFVSEINDVVRRYMSISRRPAYPVVDLRRFLQADPTKIIFVGRDGEESAAIIAAVKERLGEELEITQSNPRFVELTQRGVSKGTALEDVAEYFEVPLSRIMAIGDGFNDLDMIRTAGMGIAVANAPEPVRAAADHVTTSNDEDGVALAIERWILHQPGLELAT